MNKEPSIILEYRCDGMSCAALVQLRLEGVTWPLLREHITAAVEGAGCRFLGRHTFFCPDCADPRRRAPDSLESRGSAILPTGAPPALAGVADSASVPGVCPAPPAESSTEAAG